MFSIVNFNQIYNAEFGGGGGFDLAIFLRKRSSRWVTR